MKAIIIPLNKTLLDFEKYDGSSFAERFRKRHPKFVNKMNKGGKRFIKYMSIPIFILMLFYIMPPYLFNLIRYDKRTALKKLNNTIDRTFKKANELTHTKRKNIFQLAHDYQKQGYELFVYYSLAMIPSNRSKQNKFYTKIDLMKQKLKIFHTFETTSQAEIEKTITVFGVNIKESVFISDNNIVPVGHKQLKEETLNEIHI